MDSKPSLIFFGLQIVLMLAFLPASRASLIAYEGADYALTNSIAGLNGGTGWNGAWSGDTRVVSGSLVINGVSTSGNRFVTSGNGAGSARMIETSGFPALTENGRFGKEGTTLWLSLLFRAVTTGNNNAAGFLFFDGPVSSANQVLFVGVPTGGSTLGIIAPANSAPPLGASATSSIIGTNQQTLFLAVKFMFGTPNGDRVFLYVNPPLDSEPTNNIYIAAVLNNLSFHFDRLQIASGATATTTASFDEIRLGETFADVVPFAPDRYVVTALAALPAPTPLGYAVAPLLQDEEGHLFASRPAGGANGLGDVFRTEVTGSGFTPLHQFPVGADDGKSPGGLLLAKDGRLYGGTVAGGTGGIFGNYGVLYRINTDGSDYTILRQLNNQTDGTQMTAALLQDAAGVLYGVLRNGGTSTVNEGGNGTVFKMNTDGSAFTVLHVFKSSVIIPTSTDGYDPKDALIEGPDEMLYGTTFKGGTASRGTAFRIGKNGGGYKIIHHFLNDGTGSDPESRLGLGSDGYLYGTTDSSAPSTGATLYKLKPDGSEYRVLGRFGGAHLRQGALMEMPDGLLYGTASDGGRPIPASGYLFRIGKDGADFEVLHEFQPTGAAGRSPWGGFLKGKDGALYGATLAGGANGAGALFKIARATAPTNPPVTLVGSVTRGGNIFQLSFTGVPAGQYEIQAASQLPSGWQTLTNIPPDGNAQLQFTENISPETKSRFYRVINH